MDELAATSLLDHLDEAGRARAVELLEQVMPRAATRFDADLRRKDGTPLTVSITVNRCCSEKSYTPEHTCSSRRQQATTRPGNSRRSSAARRHGSSADRENCEGPCCLCAPVPGSATFPQLLIGTLSAICDTMIGMRDAE